MRLLTVFSDAPVSSAMSLKGQVGDLAQQEHLALVLWQRFDGFQNRGLHLRRHGRPFGARRWMLRCDRVTERAPFAGVTERLVERRVTSMLQTAQLIDAQVARDGVRPRRKARLVFELRRVLDEAHEDSLALRPRTALGFAIAEARSCRPACCGASPARRTHRDHHVGNAPSAPRQRHLRERPPSRSDSFRSGRCRARGGGAACSAPQVQTHGPGDRSSDNLRARYPPPAARGKAPPRHTSSNAIKPLMIPLWGPWAPMAKCGLASGAGQRKMRPLEEVRLRYTNAKSAMQAHAPTGATTTEGNRCDS